MCEREPVPELEMKGARVQAQGLDTRSGQESPIRDVFEEKMRTLSLRLRGMSSLFAWFPLVKGLPMGRYH